MSGKNFILGDVHFETVGKCSGCTTDSTGRVRGADGTGGVVDVNGTLVGDAADECAQTSVAAALEPCTIGSYKNSLSKLASRTTNRNVRRLTGAPGQNVVCVNEVKVSKGKTIELAGDTSTFFIINVAPRGEFTIDGGQIIAVAPVEPRDVLYNVLGNGPTVSFTGGGGGVDCCNASIDGTLLAIDREVDLSPGLINGQLCSDRKMSLDGGSGVHCPNREP